MEILNKTKTTLTIKGNGNGGVFGFDKIECRLWENYGKRRVYVSGIRGPVNKKLVVLDLVNLTFDGERKQAGAACFSAQEINEILAANGASCQEIYREFK